MTMRGDDAAGPAHPEAVLALVGDIFEEMPVALVVTAADGSIVLVNAQAGRLLGYAPGELVGRPVECLVPPGSRAGHAAQHRRYLQQPTSRPMGVAMDLTAVRRDGSTVPVEIALKPLRTATGTVVLSVIVDVSVRKQAEQRMLQSQRELETRVRDRTAELERSNREKQRMLEELEAAHRRLEQLSREDPLTGLANRREFNRRVDAELERAARTGEAVALAMLDLDHFKQVNDRYGHAVGDEVLRQVAAVMAAQCRSIDLLSRYGGEEFALAMPETTGDRGWTTCERIRTAVAAFPWDSLASGLSVTLSAGVVQCAPDDSLQSALARADALLYAAKRGGRNRTEREPPVAAPAAIADAAPRTPTPPRRRPR